MQTITIQCPDDFTDEQVAFIKASAFNQIKAEIEAKELVVTDAVRRKVEKKVKAIRDALEVTEVTP